MALGESFESVLAAARVGADWAWEALYRDLAPLVHGYLRSRGCREPEDVVGEVFLAVARDLGSFSGGERSFRSWVLTVAHHRMLDQLRYQSRRPSEPVAGEVIAGTTARGAVGGTVGGNVEDEALQSLTTARIRTLVDRLAGDQRDVLLLRIIGGLTVTEVADALNKSPGAVKALQRRGLAAVKRLMERAVVPL